MKRSTCKQTLVSPTTAKKGKPALPTDLESLAAEWNKGALTKKAIQAHLDAHWGPEGSILLSPGGKSLWDYVQELADDINSDDSYCSSCEDESGVLSPFVQSTDFALYFDLMTNTIYGPLSLAGYHRNRNEYDMSNAQTRQCFEDADRIYSMDKSENVVCLYAK